MIFKKRKPKIALVLGGGGAKGFAHIGALEALNELGISHFDCIVGNSVGSIIGAHYASHNNVSLLKKDAKDIKELRFKIFKDLSLTDSGLINGKQLLTFLEKKIGKKTFSDLDTELIINTYDLKSGRELILKTGGVLKAIRSSIAIPIIFTPVLDSDQILIDGGFYSSFPIHILKLRKYDLVIGVNLNKKDTISMETNLNLFKMAMLMIERMSHAFDRKNIRKLEKYKHGLYIQPELGNANAFSFNKQKSLLNAGYKSVMEQKVQILKILKKFVDKNGNL